MEGIFTKYFFTLMTPENIKRINKKLGEYGIIIDDETLKIIMSYLYFDTNSVLDFESKTNRHTIYRTIDREKFIKNLMDKKILSDIINGINYKINNNLNDADKQTKDKLINSVAFVDIGIRTNNLIYIQNFDVELKPESAKHLIQIDTSKVNDETIEKINKDITSLKGNTYKSYGLTNLFSSSTEKQDLSKKVGGFVVIEVIITIIAIKLFWFIMKVIKKQYNIYTYAKREKQEKLQEQQREQRRIIFEKEFYNTIDRLGYENYV
jgi:hypothetical protein